MGLTTAVSLVLAVAIFMILPYFISSFFAHYVRNESLIAIIEGLIRIAIFVLYVVGISAMKDIHRLYQYHGAEHKTIACFESGEELTPENAKKHSRFHPRCGTSFMFVMLFISILVSLGIRAVCELWIGWDFSAMTLAATGRDLSALIYTGIGLVTLPLIVGIGFEFLMYAGKHNGPIIRALSAPGIWMQRLTTREPDESQLEVAITALKCAMPEEFPDFPREEYLLRDEYNNPPEKKKGKKETAEADATEDGAQ